VIVTDVPATPVVGEKLVIVGTFAAATVNDDALVVEPPGAVTPIVPVVADTGTVTTSWVALALDTVADVPLKVTVFWFAVAENPVPEIVTVAPIGPPAGEKVTIETVELALRPIDRRLPTASYE
jgi:hypothetical protein